MLSELLKTGGDQTLFKENFHQVLLPYNSNSTPGEEKGMKKCSWRGFASVPPIDTRLTVRGTVEEGSVNSAPLLKLREFWGLSPPLLSIQ